MTDEEISAIADLLRKDFDAGMAAFWKLSPTDQQRVQSKAEEDSMRLVAQKFKQLEADGTMDKLRARHAEEQKKKKRRKTK